MKTKILAIAAVFLMIGCNDFLDINDDPNNPTRAELNTILPFVQANMFGAFGFGTSGISEILEVYVHHTVQRGNHDDYKIVPNEYSLRQAWEHNYTVGLPDMNQIIRQANSEGKPIYAGIARALKAHTFSLMVDLWGDIPYTEAGRAPEILFPAYDDDMAIYAALLVQLDSALVELDGDGIGPAADDLIYGGDVTKWMRYARSVKLSMYNKARLTSLYNAADVAALLAAGVIGGPGDDFELNYNASVTPDNRNPAFIREYAKNSPAYFISPYFFLLMNGEQACQNTLMVGIEDPRIPYYFYNQLAPQETAQNPESYRNGEFLSIWFGSFDRDPNEGFDQANSQTVAGLYPVGGPYDDGSGVNANALLGTKGASPQRLLTASAVDFIRAELALTQSSGEDARGLLVSAMDKAFAEVNIAAESVGAPSVPGVDEYKADVLALYDAGDNTDKLEIIMTQKWIQEFGTGLETYSDIRRTGFPQICDPGQDLNEFSIQTNLFPVSLPYSGTDLTNNGNAPAQRNQYLDKVFWDIN